MKMHDIKKLFTMNPKDFSKIEELEFI
jgi:hypothetical protein